MNRRILPSVAKKRLYYSLSESLLVAKLLGRSQASIVPVIPRDYIHHDEHDRLREVMQQYWIALDAEMQKLQLQ